MDGFLESHKLSKLKQEEIENLNKPITSKEIKSVIRNLPNKQKSRARWLLSRILKTILKRTNNYSEAVSKIEIEGEIPNSFYEASLTLTPKPDKDPTKK